MLYIFLIAPVIQLPANFTASTTEFMAQIFVDLGGPLGLIFGTMIGVTAIGILIHHLTK